MASENKTKPTKVSVKAFIDSLPNEQRRKDARELVKIFEEVTGYKATMWGPTIIGFGHCHYKYESGREGDMPIAGFSPRKDALVLYFEVEFPARQQLLDKLGPYKAGKSCVYIKNLESADESVIKKLIIASIEETRRRFG